ncbi:MAG: molecular chaperone DnaK [Longimicrobiaceae bacterium]
MAKIIGIDLGTTNSCVSVFEQGRFVVIPNTLGGRLMPSVVRIREDGTVIVGEHAARTQATDPRHTISGVKRLIGRRYNEIADLAAPLPYEVIVGENNFAMVRVHGAEYSPQWISARILSSLKEAAEAYLGEPVIHAVITVPAYFNERQRQATREAGRLAGLEVLRIITEPTAASLAYGLDREGDALIAVFDLGGGTFDISILEMGEGVFEVKAVNGDGYLGGDDFDERIVAWMVEEFHLEHGIDLSTDPGTMERIRSEAVRGKCELSERTCTTLHVPFVTWKDGRSLSLDLELTRSHFEEICDELFERLVEPCERALEDAGWLEGRVRPDRVVLVGGATRMARVAKIVRGVFGIDPSRSVNPDEAVAVGAAIQGSVLSGDQKNTLLLDVIPSSLGLEDGRGNFMVFFRRSTTTPTKKTETLTTTVDDQTSVEIHVLEGEHPQAIGNRTLLRFILDGLPPVPAGILQIEVTFDIDANHVLHVMARDRETGREMRRRVEVESGITSHQRDGAHLF